VVERGKKGHVRLGIRFGAGYYPVKKESGVPGREN